MDCDHGKLQVRKCFKPTSHVLSHACCIVGTEAESSRPLPVADCRQDRPNTETVKLDKKKWEGLPQRLCLTLNPKTFSKLFLAMWMAV